MARASRALASATTRARRPERAIRRKTRSNLGAIIALKVHALTQFRQGSLRGALGAFGIGGTWSGAKRARVRTRRKVLVLRQAADQQQLLGTAVQPRAGKSRVARQPEKETSRRSVCVACHVAQVAGLAPRASTVAMQVPLLTRRLLALLAANFLLLLPTGCDQDSTPPASIPRQSHEDTGLQAMSDAPGTQAIESPAATVPTLPDPAPGADGKVRLSDDEWRARLTPEQFKILRGAGTERPFSCPLWKISDAPGIYHCGGCGLALFDSADKFDSGTGWPSFSHPIAPDRILEKRDSSYGMIRVETLCARCEGHLGHVFDDGPPPAGKRYCINGTVLRFAPAKAQP